jgi:plastocyanin
MRILLLAFAAGAAVACVAPLLAAPAGDLAATVAIDNFAFMPQELTIRAGTTVTWTNRDDIPHTVTAADRSFKSNALDTDESHSFTFSAAGEYKYFCSLHPHMTGTIVVEGARSAAAR